MATTVSLPELGENIDSGTVTSILVNVGDSVDMDTPLLELETDKAVVEVPSPASGVVASISITEGATLEVGGAILVLDGAGTTPVATATTETKPEPTPELEPTPEPEPTPEYKPEPETISVPKAPAPAPKTAPVVASSGAVRAAPSVRKLAREIGVDISVVVPSDSKKGITAADVKAHAKGGATVAAPAAGGSITAGSAPLSNFEKWGGVKREAMSKIRQVTVQSMTRSWTTIPHVTQNDLADITEMEKFRKAHGKAVQAAGGKLTATGILVKVLCEALKRFPQFNSSIDVATSEIIFKEYYNIGIAVDTEHGLMVPNIKDVDKKGLTEISVEMSAMSERARTRKIGLAELQGTCMTITNLGGIGGTSFTPIVNSPEVAILGVSRSRMEPVYIDGEFKARNMMPISLSYDHRVIDGADAARFTRWICQTLENPMTLLLDA
jgi:pyruvate dehydrogenase E2 component (dihydrolipoamide acetyltransferase)